MRVYSLDQVRISTICANMGFLIIGGFNGEYAVQRLRHDMSLEYGNLSTMNTALAGDASTRKRKPQSWSHVRSGYITTSYNGITNHIDITQTRQGRVQAIISSNDEYTRTMDLEDLKITSAFKFPWAVNVSRSMSDSPLSDTRDGGSIPLTSLVKLDSHCKLVLNIEYG